MGVRIIRSEDRYHAREGWLDTYYSFSFANYYDPRNLHFGVLRVFNEDVFAPGHGFGWGTGGCSGPGRCSG